MAGSENQAGEASQPTTASPLPDPTPFQDFLPINISPTTLPYILNSTEQSEPISVGANFCCPSPRRKPCLSSDFTLAGLFCVSTAVVATLICIQMKRFDTADMLTRREQNPMAVCGSASPQRACANAQLERNGVTDRRLGRFNGSAVKWRAWIVGHSVGVELRQWVCFHVQATDLSVEGERDVAFFPALETRPCRFSRRCIGSCSWREGSVRVSMCTLQYITFTFSQLADALIQSDLQ